MRIFITVALSRVIPICFLLGVGTGCATTPASNPDSTTTALKQVSLLVSRYGEQATDSNNEYLAYLRDRLLRACCFGREHRGSISLVVVRSSESFAFSPGGGFIILSKGLISRVKNEAELAFVLAHEIGHECLGHSVDNDSFIRSTEAEIAADKYGLGVVALAGYDPRFSVDALVHLYPSRYDAPNQPDRDELVSRISLLQQTLQSSGWQPPGTTDRRDFHRFKRTLY